MLSKQQKRLRKENYCIDNCKIDFSEKTCNDKDIKLAYYGTIQDLYDYEFEKDNQQREYD